MRNPSAVYHDCSQVHRMAIGLKTELGLLYQVVLLLLALQAATVACAQALHVIDDRGQAVHFPAPPQRIVSILPSLTESVCALGQCHRLVGVDRYSNWPASLARLPRVGGGLDPNIEAIVALRPDVVFVSTASRGSDRLEALGLKVVALDAQTHAEVQRLLKNVGAVLGLAPHKAVQIWQQIDADLSAAAHTVPVAARGTRVYFEVNSTPYAAGAASFIGETLRRLGAHNIVGAELGPFPKLNPEFVVRANPAVMLLGQRNLAGLHNRPGWQGIQAFQEQRFCIFSPEVFDTIIRPGPRMAEGARELARCLRNQAPGARP